MSCLEQRHSLGQRLIPDTLLSSSPAWKRESYENKIREDFLKIIGSETHIPLTLTDRPCAGLLKETVGRT